MKIGRQDPSLLVDLCRQSIVFEDLTGVAACLRGVGEDPDVDLIRVARRPAAPPTLRLRSRPGWRGCPGRRRPRGGVRARRLDTVSGCARHSGWQ